MKDKLFLDANVLFSAAYRQNSGLHFLWRLTDVDLISSNYAVEVARRNLSGKQNLDLDALLKKAKVVSVMPTAVKLEANINLPEKDRPILLVAIHIKATHLITGDITHFGAYFNTRIHGVLIVNPAGYSKGRQKTI